MAIRYVVNKGTLCKVFYDTAPYLLLVFQARFFWDTLYWPGIIHYTWRSMMAELKVTQFGYALGCFFHTSPTGHQSMYMMITFQHCHRLDFGYSFRRQKLKLWQDSLKIHWAISRTTSPILGLFVLIWMHFPC